MEINKKYDEGERLNGIAIGTANITRELNDLTKTINENTKILVKALDNNSKSSNFLANVGICIGIIGAIATIFGTYYGYLSYIKEPTSDIQKQDVFIKNK